VEKVIIIGGGPAGLTAAIYLARGGLSPLVIEGAMAGGQLTLTTEVENYPGFPEGVNGPELIMRMHEQAEKFAARFLTADVDAVSLVERPYKVLVEDDVYETRALVIATGSNARWLELPSEQRLIGRGVSSCATCDGAFYKGKIVCVVGGGDTACEDALFLTRFARKVYIVHRRDALRASKIMADRVKKHAQIEILWNKVVAEVQGDQLVSGVVLRDTKTAALVEKSLHGVFIAIGHTPNTDFLQDQLELDANGYIKHTLTHTNVPGVFACGDVADPLFRQAITSAGTGCMAALNVSRYLEENAP